MTIRRFVRNTLIILAVTLGLLLVLELGVRLFFGGSKEFDRPYFAGGNHERLLVEDDATKFYRLRPGFRGVDQNPDFHVPVHINAQGLRDEERSLPYSFDGLRILGVGDSFTYAEGVKVEDGYLAVLEEELRKSHSKVDVINAGVPGYGPTQMIVQAEELLDVYEPSILLVGLFYSAIDRDRDPYVHKEGFIVRGSSAHHLELVGGNLWYSPHENETLRTWHARLMGTSYLVRWLTRRSVLMAREVPEGPPTIKRPPQAELRQLVDAKIEKACTGLLRLRKACQERSCRLVVVLIPEKREHWVSVPNSKDIADRLRAWGQETQIEILDLREALGAFGQDRVAYYYTTDAHWNPLGHEVVGKTIAEKIR